MFGACSRVIYKSCTSVTWILRLFIGKINLGQNMRICSVPTVYLRGGEYSALPLFRGVVGNLAKLEVHKPPGIGNIFAAIAACHVYKCIQGNITSLWHHMPLWSAGDSGENSGILLQLSQLYVICQMNTIDIIDII